MTDMHDKAHSHTGASHLDRRLTTDPFELRFYTRDMALVPGFLVQPFFRTIPDALARPRSTQEAAEAIRQAMAQGLAIVPRAAATTALFNAVPLQGGLALDLTGLSEVIAVDERQQTVTVQAGVRWLDLERALQPHGLAVKSYPSSAIAATVGGWLSTQGHGLGSLKYGSFLEQVVRAEVILPDGQVRSVNSDTHPPLHWFAAAEGTLGVLTEIELTVRRAPEEAFHNLLAFDSLPELQTALGELARSEPRPYTLSFSDEALARMLALSGYSPPATRHILLVSYQGETSEVEYGKERLKRLSLGETLAPELAMEVWNDRLYHLRVKRGGPSLLAAEMWLPIDGLASYLAGVKVISRKFRTLIGSYGLVVSPRQILLMSVYHCDARHTLDYTLALGLTGQLYRLGARHGGCPYGVGLWNTPYLSQIVSRQQLAELRARKQALDPANRMNPGKLYRAPFFLSPTLFQLGTSALAAAYRLRAGRSLGDEHA